MTTWVEVLTAMVDGPSKPITGVVETILPEGHSETFGWAGAPPVVVGLPLRVRMWRDGSRLRVDLLDGTPAFRSDGESVWRFGSRGEPPLRAERRRIHYTGPGRTLIQVRPAGDWAGSDDFTRPTDKPIESVEFLGRAAWEVELAPPQHKPHPIQQVVDKETGAVLQSRNDAFGMSSSFVEFEVLDGVDAAFFSYDGPVVEDADRRQAQRQAADAEREEQCAWFRENVGATEVSIPVTLDARLDHVHRRDADGGFEATLRLPGHRHASLARRPRSDEPWELRWSGEVSRWSTAEFDWAVTLHDLPLDDAALASLQEQLQAPPAG